jgi:hypothetical protein
VKRFALPALVALVAVATASASSGQTLRGDGVRLSLPRGWHGLLGPGGVQAADFPLPRRARDSASLVRVRRGHVQLIVWNYGPWSVYLPRARTGRPPLAFRRRDVSQTGFEGFPAGHFFARRSMRLGGDELQLLADLGPGPLVPSAVRRVNAVLATLRVLPPKLLRPQAGRLAADGVAVRVPSGWSGHMEIPAGHYGARLVLRAARDGVHLELLEVATTDPPPHADLPLVLTSRNVSHRSSLAFAHRVFSTGGHSFVLNVTARSLNLHEVNRFLATLAVVPRSWTFRSCDLTLRLPGSWSAAIRPRNGCYPVLKLRGPGAVVVLTELRAGERANGRIIRRAGRRFEVDVTPASARRATDRILATLRAEPRSTGFPQSRSTALRL